jgi:tight adherence protein C
MNPLTLAVLSFAIVVGVTFVAGVLLLRLLPAVRRGRFSAQAPETGGDVSILRWDQEATEGWQRTVERVGAAVVPKDMARRSKYSQRLGWAGYHDPRTLAYFMGAKVVAAIAAGLSYPFLGILQQEVMPNVASVSLICFVLGFFLPDFWLSSRTKVRQRAIVNAVPDVLDLLMVCVEAGMGFDAAVARVADQPDLQQKSPLHQELLRMHLEVRAGRPREEALRALGERTGVQEVKSMVAAFIQTDRLGTPLGKTLRVHAESARVERRHRAEERAYLAPLKMIFPTVFFLMPAFFLVAMGPSLLGLVRAFRTLQ